MSSTVGVNPQQQPCTEQDKTSEVVAFALKRAKLEAGLSPEVWALRGLRAAATRMASGCDGDRDTCDVTADHLAAVVERAKASGGTAVALADDVQEIVQELRDASESCVRDRDEAHEIEATAGEELAHRGVPPEVGRDWMPFPYGVSLMILAVSNGATASAPKKMSPEAAAGLLVDGSNEELMRQVAGFIDRQVRSGPGDADEDATESEECRRLVAELALRGLPRWFDLGASPYAGSEYEQAARHALFALHMERRAWLCSTKSGLQQQIVGPWRVIVGPTSVDAELCVPERVVVIDRYADSVEPLGPSSRDALEALRDFAEELDGFGVDTEATLGVSLREIARAHVEAVQREQAREARREMESEKLLAELAKSKSVAA